MIRILVGSDKPWTRNLTFSKDFLNSAAVTRVSSQSELLHSLSESDGYDYLFFPFWSKYVPSAVFENFKTVIFHMTDLPHGRGGSPLQNLILEGAEDTKISAIRCVRDVDTGDVYLKKALSLKGSAQEIYERAVPIIAGMIETIALSNPTPVPQHGTVKTFSRRTPAQSEIPLGLSVEKMYDYIRMLDAVGYPRAFVRHGNLKITFMGSSTEGPRIITQAIIEEGLD
jgi:methionyl-tRNA formyltransferase